MNPHQSCESVRTADAVSFYARARWRIAWEWLDLVVFIVQPFCPWRYTMKLTLVVRMYGVHAFLHWILQHETSLFTAFKATPTCQTLHYFYLGSKFKKKWHLLCFSERQLLFHSEMLDGFMLKRVIGFICFTKHFLHPFFRLSDVFFFPLIICQSSVLLCPIKLFIYCAVFFGHYQSLHWALVSWECGRSHPGSTTPIILARRPSALLSEIIQINIWCRFFILR